MANSAENILTLINTRVETAAARQLWPASGRLASRSWTDSVAMTLGILATTSATPADDRAAAFRPRTSPRRRALRGAGHFTNGRSARPDGHLASSAGGPSFTNERRLAAFARRSAAYDERPGPRGVRLINNLTLGTKPAPEHAPTLRRADAAPRRRVPTYETKRPFRYLRAASLAF